MLKASRRPVHDDVSHFCLTAAERGGVASYTNAASFGTGMDEPNNIVAYSVNPSGARPAGVLIETVENVDPTRVPRNFQDPYTVPVGSKVRVIKKGEVVTDMVDPVTLSSVQAGQTAYLAASGLVSNAQATGAPAIGTFQSYPDSDDYVKLSVNID